MNCIGTIGFHGFTPAQQNFDADDAIDKVVVTAVSHAENVAVECAAEVGVQAQPRLYSGGLFVGKWPLLGRFPRRDKWWKRCAEAGLRDSLGDKPAFQ
jgi:hypothetical protein